MPPSARVRAAFQAMKDIGIPEHKTKPALKNLLKLYEKKWELIEEENYRVLADAIFEYEDTESAEKEKKKTAENNDQAEALEKEAQMQEEPERPLKRLRLKHQGQAEPSHGQSGPMSGGYSLKIPKPEPGEPEAQPNTGNRRTESQPISPQPLVRNKGKQPMSPHNMGVTIDRPQPSAPHKRAGLERASQGLQLKEPKIKPVVGLNGRNNALIKPKDEPFTDDMLSLEPLAVVLPEPSQQETPSNFRNPVDDQDGQRPMASKSFDETDKGMGPVHKASVPEKPVTIDIATTPLGEVKMSLSCNPGLIGDEFHIPDLPVVMNKMNDDCRKTYKITNPEFSVPKLMGEFCVSVLELGTGVTQVRSSLQDARVNGSANADFSDDMAPTTDATLADVLNQPSASNCPQIHNGSNNSATDNHATERNPDSVGYTNVRSLVVVQEQQQFNLDGIRCLYDENDVTKGKEEVKVLLEKSNSVSLPSFHYIAQNVVSHNANVVFSLDQIGDKDCCLSCYGDCLLSPSCNCAQRNGGESPYTSDGLVTELFLEECISMVRNPQRHNLMYCKECPLEKSKNEDMLDPCKGHLKRKFIKECSTKCGCHRYCGNRVVQRGIRCQLQVFWTLEGKGWGLRTLEDLPKGAFVCEYVGEILTNTELYKRNIRRSNDKHSYAVLLDSDWGSRTLKDEEVLCLDATFYGNVARFINHRCSDANLIEIPVEMETPNHHYYHVALFTTRKVNAFEELTWDYGVDFDDNEHHIKAFRCLCGSQFCRNMKRSSRCRTLT